MIKTFGGMHTRVYILYVPTANAVYTNGIKVSNRYMYICIKLMIGNI